MCCVKHCAPRLQHHGEHVQICVPCYCCRIDRQAAKCWAAGREGTTGLPYAAIPASLSRDKGGGRDGVASVCALPGVATLRLAVDNEDSPPRGVLALVALKGAPGVLSSFGVCAAGGLILKRSGGYSLSTVFIIAV